MNFLTTTENIPDKVSCLKIPIRSVSLEEIDHQICEQKFLEWVSTNVAELSKLHNVDYTKYGNRDGLVSFIFNHSLMTKFVTQFIIPTTKNQQNNVNLIILMDYLGQMQWVDALTYDIKLNRRCLIVQEHFAHLIFDDNFVIITPRVFGDFIFYGGLNYNGVKLHHLCQCANIHVKLDVLGLNWKIFNTRLQKNIDSNEELSKILPDCEGYPIKVQIYNTFRSSGTERLRLPVYQIYDSDEDEDVGDRPKRGRDEDVDEMDIEDTVIQQTKRIKTVSEEKMIVESDQLS